MEYVLDDPRWPKMREDTGALGRYTGEVHDLWDRGLEQWDYEDAEPIFRGHGGSMFPCLDYEEFAADPQVEATGVFVDVVDDAGNAVRDARPPWQFSATRSRIDCAWISTRRSLQV